MKYKNSQWESVNTMLNNRENNFDIIRLMASILVLYSHSFPLSQGIESHDPFINWTRGHETFGGLGVSIFFIISGFFITYSYERSANIYVYIRNRILRVYPALIFVLIITVFILGPIFTNLDLKTYFLNGGIVGYLESFMLVNMHYSLPGVFENNPYPNAINGSLWTLWYEVFFYIIVALLGTLKLIKKQYILPLFILIFILSIKIDATHVAFQYVNLFKYFSMGILVYLYKNEIKLNMYLAILSFIVLLAMTIKGYYNIAFIFTGTYLIFYCGLGLKKYFRRFQEKGDFSYGMYIFAFPIQQMVTFCLMDQITPLLNFIISLPLTFILSVFSWNFIENRFLKLKNTRIYTEVR